MNHAKITSSSQITQRYLWESDKKFIVMASSCNIIFTSQQQKNMYVHIHITQVSNFDSNLTCHIHSHTQHTFNSCLC